MIEEIVNVICRYAGEKVKLSKGVIALIAIAAFVLGLLSGAVAARFALGKKPESKYSEKEEFDADEYVRNLNFDGLDEN
ncbi:MAG: hypothetical protein NC120_00360 [Ruminococcus sp.]|nr:hypothetical protein [Ruminococcus sp.]